MWKFWILIAGLTATIIGLTIRYCRMIKRKNRSIARQIREQEHLEQLLDNAFHKIITLSYRLNSMHDDIHTDENNFEH